MKETDILYALGGHDVSYVPVVREKPFISDISVTPRNTLYALNILNFNAYFLMQQAL